MDLKGRGCEDINSTHLAQDGVHWRTVMNTEMSNECTVRVDYILPCVWDSTKRE
jgi:hypothetical protein